MGISDKKIRINKRNYILGLTLLLLTNIITSYIIVFIAHEKLHKQIENRMFDIANTAADGVVGDFLADYQGTEEEKNTQGYQYSMFVLETIHENIDLSYIYCVRHVEGDRFVFILDPDKEAPAGYGQEIVTTDALRTAQSGTPAVDKKPHTDEWGSFYSAYSPVFDSNGNVVSVIGVDFDSEQHNSIIHTFNYLVFGLSAAAFIIGLILATFIMIQNKKRMAAILENVDNIENEMKKLDSIIIESSNKKLEMLPESENAVLKTLASGEENNDSFMTEYDALKTGTNSLYNRLKNYIKYIDNEMYTDNTTGVYNKGAYKQKTQELDDNITAGNAGFSVAFFDINGIKKIYIHYGYETGDQLLFECAKHIIQVFGKKHTYHITGDEFIVIVDKRSFEMKELFAEFDELLEKYNTDHVKDHILSVAKGFETYDAEKHSNFRDVLMKAKENCDKDKAEHYKVSAY